MEGEGGGYFDLNSCFGMVFFTKVSCTARDVYNIHTSPDELKTNTF